MRKYILLSVMLLVASLSYVGAYAAEKPTTSEAALVLNCTEINTNAYINKGMVYIPIRAAGEALGYTVGWKLEDGASLVPLTKSNDEIVLNLTYDRVNDNGHSYFVYSYADSDPFVIYEGKAYMEAGLFSDVFGYNADYDNQSKQVTLSKINENAITIRNESKHEEQKNLIIDLQYPQIQEMKNTEIQTKINELFKNAATDAENEGIRNVAELGEIGAAKYAADFNYRIRYNQNDLFSLTTYDYQYAGGAHGSTIENSYTINLKTGEILNLSDLLNKDSHYLDYINSVIRSEIDKKVAVGELFELTPFKTIGDKPAFHLSNDSLVIYFQQYEYFPYAAGLQEFNIPFVNIKDKLLKEYSFLYREPVQLKNGVENYLPVGNLGKVTLKGNPTTGYSWHYVIADSTIFCASSQSYVADSAVSGVVGAGGTYNWEFRALKTGKTTITFKYYRDWEGESSATSDNTVVYNVTVQ